MRSGGIGLDEPPQQGLPSRSEVTDAAVTLNGDSMLPGNEAYVLEAAPMLGVLWRENEPTR
jgi:hypothetical protein